MGKYEWKQQTVAGLIGGAVSFITSIGSLLVLAWLVLGSRVGETHASAWICAIVVIGASVGGVVSGKLAKQNGGIAAVISAVVFCVILVILSLLVMEGSFQSLWKSVAFILLGSSVGGCVTNRKTAKRRKRKTHYR